MLWYRQLWCFCAFVGLSSFASGLKILGIYPQPYKSHINFNNGVLKTLAENGHHITMISPFRECAKENYTYIDTSNQTTLLINSVGVDEYTSMDTALPIRYILEDELPLCYNFVKLEAIQKAFNSKEKPFDVIFVETLTTYPCFMALARKWKIPVIGTITLPQWTYADYAIDNPRYPAYVGDEITPADFYRSFYGRLTNTLNSLIRIYLWYHEVRPRLEQFFYKQFGQTRDQVSFDELRPSLIFYNGHSSISPRPMNPNAIEIAGIHIREPKPLPKDLQKFIDESKDGVILFSLGSVLKASSLSQQTQQNLLRAFATLPQRVIWKFEDKLENVPDNVLIMKWLPQRDILGHKNVKAFISHCGLSGTYETIYEAVPVISIPVFADQKANSRVLEMNGAAFLLDKDDLTKENILRALHAVVYDTSYAENMRKLSQRFKDRPLSPQQSVLYWTEYVYRHNGAPHLKTAASTLAWFQYLLIDVLLFIITVFIIVTMMLKYLLRKVFSIICKRIPSNSSKIVNKNKKRN